MEGTSHERFTTTRGLEYSYYRAQPTEKALAELDPADPPLPALLFLHGFPTSAHLWSRQVKYFRERGFLVLALDLLGFGGTSKPRDPNAYRASLICKDIIELLDAEGLSDGPSSRGSKVVSRLANFYPNRCLAYAFLAVPYSAPRPMTNIEYTLWATKKMCGYELNGHTLFYAEDDADKLIESRLDSFFSALFAKDPKMWVTEVAPIGALKSWLQRHGRAVMAPYISEDSLTVWRNVVSQDGIGPALCWHKAYISGLNAEDDKPIPLENYPVHKPVFFGAANHDYISRAVLGIATTNYHCKNATIRTFHDGHWLMVSSHAEVNAALFDWIMDCH